MSISSLLDSVEARANRATPIDSVDLEAAEASAQDVPRLVKALRRAVEVLEDNTTYASDIGDFENRDVTKVLADIEAILKGE